MEINKIKTKLKKAALFTDIHYGAHQNSERHNLDCIDYINWFISEIKKDPYIDHIIFLGDYFEHRHSVSGMTLHYAYQGARLINELGIPIFWLSGNHDYFNRNNRNIFNTESFDALSNVIMINDITVIDFIGEHGVVMAPYLFNHEYPNLIQYLNYPYLFIHGEFKGFVVTGDTVTCEHGTDHKTLSSFKRICSGHFHKFQEKDNITYIGNTFPTNYADANDIKRGMSTLEYDSNIFRHISWPDCPTYTNCTLSQIIETPSLYLKPKGSVRAIVDTDIEHADLLILKEKLFKKYELRELYLENNKELDLSGDSDIEAIKHDTIDNIVKIKLKTVTIDDIDTDLLISEYDDLGKN